MNEEYEFEVDRVWDVNGCCPPCCPYTLLFGTTDGLFVYVETWQEIGQLTDQGAQSKLRIESTPRGKYSFKTAIERERIQYSDALREFNEFFEMNDRAEWKVYKREELPEKVITLLDAV